MRQAACRHAALQNTRRPDGANRCPHTPQAIVTLSSRNGVSGMVRASPVSVTPVLALPRLFHPPRVTRRDDHDRVMQKAIEQRNRRRLNRQEVTPLLEWPMAGHAQAAALVGGSHEAEQQLAAGVVEWSEAQLVNQNQLVAQQTADDFADGVV